MPILREKVIFLAKLTEESLDVNSRVLGHYHSEPEL